MRASSLILALTVSTAVADTAVETKTAIKVLNKEASKNANGLFKKFLKGNRRLELNWPEDGMDSKEQIRYAEGVCVGGLNANEDDEAYIPDADIVAYAQEVGSDYLEQNVLTCRGYARTVDEMDENGETCDGDIFPDSSYSSYEAPASMEFCAFCETLDTYKTHVLSAVQDENECDWYYAQWYGCLFGCFSDGLDCNQCEHSDHSDHGHSDHEDEDEDEVEDHSDHVHSEDGADKEDKDGADKEEADKEDTDDEDGAAAGALAALTVVAALAFL
jgi:hypothetical protein